VNSSGRRRARRRTAGLGALTTIGFLALVPLVWIGPWADGHRVVGAAGILLVGVAYVLALRLDRNRKRARHECPGSHARFEVALRSLGDAVLVADEHGRLEFCNEAARDMLSLRSEDHGRPLVEILTFVAESGGAVHESIVARASREGGVHRTGAEEAIRLADGARLPVDATAAAIRGQGGVVLVVRDVSLRRERERELARGNERFRAFVMATSQVLWTTDADGQAREDSPSWRQLTGQTYEQWKGLGGLDAVHPEDRGRSTQGWKDAIAARRPYVSEHRLRLADGTYRWSMVRAAPVFDADGTLHEWVGMVYDIQARKEVEGKLRDTSRRKDEFIALLAHELRNPLAPLRNGLEVLKFGAPEAASRAIGLMDRQVSHMVRLIDDLLDVSRINQGKLELRLERIDLREVLKQAVDAARPAVDAKGQELDVSLPASPMWIDGDPVRLAQVVTNLLNNAVKYSAAGASIWVAAEREGTRHLVTVRDTGQGIPADLLPHVWDLFLQGGGLVERDEGGLGIGLTLVKRLVELHHGNVSVHSDGRGAGSEFTIRLPIAAAGAVHAPEEPAPSRPTVRALRILVVDDNEDAAESLSMLLRIGGHVVRAAFRGESALAEFERFVPEIVLCDIRMPDMSGYEVARRLRALPGGSAPLLVALTGFGTVTDRESSARAGFDRHLVKPADPDALAELLCTAAQRSSESVPGSRGPEGA